MTSPILPFNSFGLKLSAPLSEDSGEATFISEGGLSSSTALELSFSRVQAPGGASPGTEAEQIAVVTLGRERCAGSGRVDCKSLSFNKLAESGFLTQDERDKFRDDVFLNGPIWLWGVNAAVGYDEFDYRDATTFAEQSETRTPFSISATASTRRAPSCSWEEGSSTNRSTVMRAPERSADRRRWVRCRNAPRVRSEVPRRT